MGIITWRINTWYESQNSCRRFENFFFQFLKFKKKKLKMFKQIDNKGKLKLFVNPSKFNFSFEEQIRFFSLNFLEVLFAEANFDRNDTKMVLNRLPFKYNVVNSRAIIKSLNFYLFPNQFVSSVGCFLLSSEISKNLEWMN